jgi:hypothetical protein
MGRKRGAQPNDRFSNSYPRPISDGKRTLPFVIPSEAEGSAVLRTHSEKTKLSIKMEGHLDRSVPGFPAMQHWKRPRVWLSKESRMKFANATNSNRRSGAAEWSDLRSLPSQG